MPKLHVPRQWPDLLRLQEAGVVDHPAGAHPRGPLEPGCRRVDGGSGSTVTDIGMFCRSRWLAARAGPVDGQESCDDRLREKMLDSAILNCCPDEGWHSGACVDAARTVPAAADCS